MYYLYVTKRDGQSQIVETGDAAGEGFLRASEEFDLVSARPDVAQVRLMQVVKEKVIFDITNPRTLSNEDLNVMTIGGVDDLGNKENV